jgi:hypothetical protein
VITPKLPSGQACFPVKRSKESCFWSKHADIPDMGKPLVKFVRRPDGSYRFPNGVKLRKKDIAAAIRADRDYGKNSSTEDDSAEAAADTWEKLGPAPRIRTKKLPKK